MKLYHATDVDCLPGIWSEGLKPSPDGEHPVHLCETRDVYEFIHDLGGDIWEGEHGYPPCTVTLEVDCDGLDMDGPRRDAFTPDNPQHHMCWETIPVERIKIVHVWHGFPRDE